MLKIKNSNFTKKNISQKINLKTGLSISYTNEVTDNLISILKILIKNKDLHIKNFATFKILDKKQRLGRNPKSNKIYKISARKSLSFIAAKKLTNKIKDL
jgi:nucleoid DNA-binding protein|tara:strand:+ start:136 stop:435 length:300 start_codon:yes stop_codon:yes gene_type:complete